jgi:sortase B
VLPTIEEPTPVAEDPTAPPTEVADPPTPQLLPRIVALRETYENPDIVGFIEIPGTAIAYPVAQTGNNVFYLYHDLHWNPSNAGSIFLDYENDLYVLADDNTIIYGHNMRNGSMFHNIRFFHDEDFFRTHTYILLDTPYRETVWDIFAFFPTTIAFDYLITDFHQNRDVYYDFLMELQRRSRFETDMALSAEDQILILSTCAAIGGDNRYVLVARLRV